MPSTILSDNGVSSGSAGLKTTAASDGSLALQTTTAGGTATTAVYVDTSQRVGIGQSTPAYLLDVNGTMRLGSAGSIQPLLLRSSVTGGLLVNNTASGGAGPLIVQDNGTEVLRVTDSLVVLKGGNTAATGTGISFPATQSASSDANTLDDYEEGTFTAVLQDQSGHSSSTNVYGSYTKIGNLVNIQISIDGFLRPVSFVGTDQLLLGGLPFTLGSPPTTTYNYPLGLFVNFSGTNVGGGFGMSLRQASSTTMQVQFQVANSTSDVYTLKCSDIATSGTGTYIRTSFTYRT